MEYVYKMSHKNGFTYEWETSICSCLCHVCSHSYLPASNEPVFFKEF
jgi:hypothetical protein